MGPTLETDRARFRHAVCDGDLFHVHVTDHAFHDFNWTGSAGHDSRAQARKVEAREFRMFELSDEHRGNAVKRRAALGLNSFECSFRVKPFGWINHRRAVSDT